MTNAFLQKALLNAQAKRKNKKNGFTLIELLIVVVIIGILSGVALPNFLAQRDKAKVAAANAAATALMSACEIAMTNDESLTDAAGEVARLQGALPSATDDPQAYVTATITDATATTAAVCTAVVEGSVVATDGSYEAFGVKTAGIAS